MRKTTQACALNRLCFWVKRVNLSDIAKGIKGIAMVVGRLLRVRLGGHIPVIELAFFTIGWCVPTIDIITDGVFF